MRRGGAALAAAVGCLALVPAAGAVSSFGTVDYGSSQTHAGFTEFGSGIDIEVPRAARHSVASTEFELSRAVAQSSLTSGSPALVQVGLYRSGSAIELDTCGLSRNEYTYYSEYEVAGTNSFHCAVYGVAPALQVDSFTVANERRDGAGDWGWQIRGRSVNVSRVTFIGAGGANPEYGEELNNFTGDRCGADRSSTAGFYGTSGPGRFTGHWWAYFAANQRSPRAITKAANTFHAQPTDPGLWSIPPVTRWPQTISHRAAGGCPGG